MEIPGLGPTKKAKVKKKEVIDFENLDDMELDDLFAEFRDEESMGDERELSEKSKIKEENQFGFKIRNLSPSFSFFVLFSNFIGFSKRSTNITIIHIHEHR